jgi:hypothetical protein
MDRPIARNTLVWCSLINLGIPAVRGLFYSHCPLEHGAAAIFNCLKRFGVKKHRSNQKVHDTDADSNI